MPPKKRIIRTNLPERERAVSARLREARQYLRLTQLEFAKQVGLTRESLASYEDARVPLRLGLGLRICRQFIISEKWLATGTSPLQSGRISRFGHIPTRMLASLALNERAAPLNKDESLSGAFKRLEPIYREKLISSRMLPFPIIVVLPDDNAAMLWNALQCIIELVRDLIGQSQQAQFARDVLMFAIMLGFDAMKTMQPGVVREFRKEFLLRCYNYFKIERLAGQSLPWFEGVFWERESKNMLLTDTASSASLPPVKPQLTNLLGRANLVTRESGKKSELAAFLGAPLASVSRWLSGEREPGGETTLLLRYWVEQQEGQSKQSPGSATTPPEPKTQLGNSSYEKPKSGRKKR